jgi:hypothetical protein
MSDWARRFEEAFRQAGEQLGRRLAEQMTEGRPTRRAPGRTPASRPRILPGLSGRRRRPGEAPPLCGRAGCGKPSRTRGYCQTHYVQWLKAGAEREAV